MAIYDFLSTLSKLGLAPEKIADLGIPNVRTMSQLIRYFKKYTKYENT